jgi:hypothetical protein
MLQVENPTVRRIANQLGITITTDQLGKDNADTSTGIVVESRYFIGRILVERTVASVVTGQQFIWTVAGEDFSTARSAIARAAVLAS